MQKGFIGLIALLIGVAIIAFLLVRGDLFSLSSSVDKDGKKETKGFVEISTDAIQDARGAKAELEARDQKMLEEF